MKRSNLARKTPLKRSGFKTGSVSNKPCSKSKKTSTGSFAKKDGKRSSLRSRSKKRDTEEREYSKLRREFLTEHPRCCCCTLNASTVHHQRGKVGRLLCDARWFVPLCFPCHQWVEENHRLARELNFNGLPLVSLPSEFNVFPEVI